MLEDCAAVSAVREVEGIAPFLKECREEGMSKIASYRSYLMGKDCKGDQIPFHLHLGRGGSLIRLTDAWLSIWYEKEEEEEEEEVGEN